ncbi:MAG: LapA family protein [Spirochaetes bacterium]|nr:LapA family protein [Spirochaetota bacterium]
MSKPKLLILFIFIFLVTVIILQNPDAISLRFLWWKIELSIFALPVIIVISAAIGYLLGSINIRKRNKKQKDNKAIDKTDDHA